jgi:hypothetical protein
MTYQKEEKMEGGLKLKILSMRLLQLLMPRSSLESLASVVLVPKTWLPCLVSGDPIPYIYIYIYMGSSLYLTGPGINP